MSSSLALFKSHYSFGKSIITLDEPFSKNGDPVENSIFYLASLAKTKSLVLVEDNMTGFLEAARNCQSNNLKLVFGLRLRVTKDASKQDEPSLRNRAKYVIFARNQLGYQALIKIWSFAARDGFYYTPCIDFLNLKKLWDDNLMLVVPFYDSFLHLNAFESHFHVPEFDSIRPTFFLEKNDLPFDPFLRQKVNDYCSKNSFDTVEARSIFYRSKSDFIAYMTFRCISERTTIEKPEFNHLGSDSFNFDRWARDNAIELSDKN